MFGSKFFRGFSAVVLARGGRRKPLGVRARLLVIVLIPSIALLGVGIGAAVYLIQDGRKSKDWAEFAGETTTPAITMIEAFQSERAATMLVLAGDEPANNTLVTARKNSDSALAYLLTYSQTSAEVRPELADDMSGIDQLLRSMPMLRGGIDARALPSEQVFGAFSAIIDTIVSGNLIAATVAPDAAIAVDMVRGIPMLRAAEAISKGLSIGSTALITNRITPVQFADFTRNISDARAELIYANAILTGQRQAQLGAITDSRAWQQLVAMGDALIARGVIAAPDTTVASSDDPVGGRASTTNTTRRATAPAPADLPLSIGEWTNATTEIRSALLKLWQDQSSDAHARAIAAGEEREQDSLYGAIAVVLLTLLAFLAALWLTNRLIKRMRRLREQTLELADEQLPNTIRALSDGSQTDRNVEMAPLDFGGDEIGQIADAFNRANTSAVAAAVAESQTRSGVNAVFLNIAHRSQVIVHRQLALLDTAEREEEDPKKLEVLFQLDHLATRSRRNAENLIILGGEKPGRRWRNPVPLIDVVRGSVAESLDYTRINTGKLPDLRITGGAVADVIHLIAELTDNATAFSPPQSRVAISGNQVGKGVAVEIADQGLGMSATELAERNALLTQPPDFSVAALSTDARLGLFVVAKLSQRHGISVRLTESDYGGIKAIVLIPNTLVAIGDDRSDERHTAAEDSRSSPAYASKSIPTFDPTADWTVHPSQEKPALPRRQRAVEEAAADSTGAWTGSARSPRRRSADEARNLMSAIESGTRQGRTNRAEIDIPTTQSDRQEGAGDNLQAP
ncbi:sensor histidine kinase [Nocardia noduli]|uniref:sensor histidine kinase n=1 Tax=Nocardia noduli TaxID=2815722 RepID=UPI0027DEB3C2|nr:nitrate- and nitrite sensing domain-containing protein [Nocardia noduli]